MSRTKIDGIELGKACVVSMKFKKFLSGFLFGFGCVVIFIGLAALILPMVGNDQLRLVLDSFTRSSQNHIVNLINSIMTFALGNCYLMMIIGAGIALIGALSMLLIHPKETTPTAAVKAPAPYTVTANDAPLTDIPVWRASKAPVAKANNPFADTSLSQMLTPRAAVATSKEMVENPFASFSPTAQPVREAVATASSHYARPFAADPFAAWSSTQGEEVIARAVTPFMAEPAAVVPENSTFISATPIHPIAPAFIPPTFIASTIPALSSSSTPRPVSPITPVFEPLHTASPKPDKKSSDRIVIRSTFSSTTALEPTADGKLPPCSTGSQSSDHSEILSSFATIPDSAPVPPVTSIQPTRIKSTMGNHN